MSCIKQLILYQQFERKLCKTHFADVFDTTDLLLVEDESDDESILTVLLEIKATWPSSNVNTISPIVNQHINVRCNIVWGKRSEERYKSSKE